MAEVAERMDALKDIRLRVGLFGAEASTEEMRAELERRCGILATENYGLTEVMGPGVSRRVRIQVRHAHQRGLLPGRDHRPGYRRGAARWASRASWCITTLAKEAHARSFATVRATLPASSSEPCACGRTQLRMEKIKGRSDDMLIIRGVNVFPSQIESVLVGQPGIGPHYEIVVTREHFTDHLQVKVELVDASLLEKYSELEKVRDRIRAQLRTVLQLDVEVTLVSPNTLKRFEGKAKRVTDLR